MCLAAFHVSQLLVVEKGWEELSFGYLKGLFKILKKTQQIQMQAAFYCRYVKGVPPDGYLNISAELANRHCTKSHQQVIVRIAGY